MGAYSIRGGLYFDSYSVLPGVDGVIPVDVYYQDVLLDMKP